MLLDPLIPDVPVSIQGAAAVPVEDDAFSAKNKRSRLVLIPNVQRVFEPILNVCAELYQCQLVYRKIHGEVSSVYQEGPVDINFDIFEPCDVQDGIDIVSGVLEDDLAAMAAFVKGLADSRGIVRVTRPAPCDNAFISVAGGGDSREKAQPYNRCGAHLVDDRCEINRAFVCRADDTCQCPRYGR